jgi:asparagine synthase (glutamine-hydrolysing)
MFESNKLGKKIFEKFNLTSNKTQKFINIFFNDKNIYESFLKLSSETNFLYKNNIFFDKNIFDLQELRNFDIKNYMVDDILTKVDRSSMFNSVEARSPLLDKNIYDYINKVPLKKNINVFSKKKILKKILENKLPKNFISKKKRGFAVPITKYLFRDLKNELYENYNNFKNDDRLACINMTNLIEIINRFFLHNDYKLSYQVWSFYVFFQWFKKYQKYIDN